MAKADWNMFYYNQLPTQYWETPISDSGYIPAGTTGKVLRLEGYGAIDGDTFGYLYNGGPGPTSDGLILDGSANITIRSKNTAFGYYNAFFGTIMRAQGLWNGSVSAGDLSFYGFGIYYDHTEDATGCRCRWWRILSNSETYLYEQYIPNFDTTNYYMQFETRLVNNVSDNVECWIRWNTGSSWNEPDNLGGGTWSTWSLLGTDTGHGGVLNQAGYWGFGKRSDATSGGTDNYVYIKNVYIAREVYG
jgi:hypothetical protein